MIKSALTELKDFVPRPPVVIGWLVLAGALCLAYSSSVAFLIQKWQEPDYGHGFFVPLFSVVLLWLRREMIRPLPNRGSWWGLAFIALAAAMYCGGTYFHVLRLAPISILPCSAGIVLLTGGWRAMRWAWPSLVFLIFMIPLPGFLDVALRHPLQRIGTIISVYVIQTLGIPAVAQGNVIQLTEGQLGVVEACSGIRMLMLFFAICIGAVFVLRCAMWEKIVIVISAIPIAVFSNVTRITVTAILYETARKWPDVISTETADWFFHDMAGLLMMPLALLLLWGEMILFSKLLLEPVAKSTLSVSLAGSLHDIGSGKTTSDK